MACKLNDISIINDDNGKIASILKQITKGVINGKQKLPIFVTYVNDGRILSYIKENNEKYSDITSLNEIPDDELKNVLKTALNNYYKENHLTVKDNLKNKDNQEHSLKFSSNNARQIAIDYCSVFILKAYGNSFLSSDNKENNNVIKNLKDDILKKIFSNYNSIIEELENEYKRTRSKEIKNKIFNIKDNLIFIKSQYDTVVKEYRKLLDEYNSNPTEELEDKLDKVYDNAVDLKRNYTIALTNAMAEYGNTMEQNLTTLYDLINQNNEEFINAIINSPKIYALKHQISKETAQEQSENDNADDVEDVIIPDNVEGIDETAKSWVDALYSSFDKNYGAKIKLYFNTLPLLKTEASLDNSVYDINNDNELGLETYMDANYILGVLNVKANTSSISAFLESIQKISSTNPYFYGLMKLVNDMRQNQFFANYVLYELNNPRIDKAISTIGANSYEFKHSNKASDYTTYYINRMINSLKSTFREFYSPKEANDFNTKYRSNYFDNVTTEELANRIESAKNDIKNILKSFFPNISENSIEDYLNSGDQVNKLKLLITNINSLYDQIEKLIVEDDKINDEYYKELKDWKSEQLALSQALSAGYDIKQVFKEKPLKDYKKLSEAIEKFLYKPCIQIGQVLSEYDMTRFDLNSANAENNLSTDLMKNSYITNLFRQIEFATPEDAEAGLKDLRDFIIRSDFYNNSTLFFGVVDANGKVIREGLFTKNGDKITISKNAKQMIHFILFDGVKNEISGDGVMYNNLNKSDYLITQIKAFTNPTKTRFGNNTEFGDMAGYFSRTPSDAPRNYIIQTHRYSLSDLFRIATQEVNDSNLTDFINKNKSQIYWALYDNLYGELNNFISQLNSVLEKDSNGNWVEKNNTKNLIDKVHYGKNGVIFKNNELQGNIFKFIKLFETNGFNVDSAMKDAFLLYGGADQNNLFNFDINDKVYLNLNHSLITYDEQSDKLTLKVDNSVKIKLLNILNKWITNYKTEIDDTFNEFEISLSENGIEKGIFNEWAMNAVVANMSFDDLLEGDVRQYLSPDNIGDARNVLKRAKEVQAGGKQYVAYNFNNGLDTGIKNLLDSKNNPILITDKLGNLFGKKGFKEVKENSTELKENEPIYMRNGYRAITVKNIRRKFEAQKNKIYEELKKEFSKKYKEDVAHQLALDIALGYTKSTAIDDAQSWITFEEFIRRRVADGTIEEYRDLIEQILDVRNGNKRLDEIDLKGITKRIQVQKNFYFDKVYSKETGVYYNRQIKNAEFVLIPELLGDYGNELKKLYNFMINNGIDQINTEETSKAGKKNIVNIWNNDATLIEDINENFDNSVIENFYYRFLYKQQDVPQHMQDAKNKAGVQIMKKIIDNTPPELKYLVDEFFDLYTTNIEESAETFLTNMGWEIDENGDVINKDGSTDLKFDEFYQRFIDEAMRLGMNSNFIESITPDKNGKPKIPNFMNVNSVKEESIAQAIFNSIITRQTLPGWHAAQITSVGHKIADENGNMRELKYHSAAYKLKEEYKEDKNLAKTIKENEFNSLDKSLKSKYEIFNEAYCEVLIPRWSNLIPKGYDINKLEKEGLDLQIAYRIPTEGKQSISKIKVVGFLNEAYGSTIVVPDEWVVQTGSDFDVDSVYAITHKLFIKRGEVKKVKYINDKSKEATQIRYINKIIDIVNKKISRNNYTDNAEKIEVKNLKDKLDTLRKKVLYKPLNAAQNEFLKVLTDLKRVDKTLAKNIFNLYNSSENKIESLHEIKNILNNNEEYKEKTKALLNVINYIIDLDINKDLNLEVYNSFKNDLEKYPNHPVASKYIEAFNDYFKGIEEIAKTIKAYSFEEFNNLDITKQYSADERSSRILDIMMEIMDHPSTKEENYSRSNFESIEDAIELINNLTKSVSKLTSAYNPFNQLQFMEDAMGGAILKAFSVTRDTFCSICSKVKAELNDEHSIYVKYDLNKFNVDVIKEEYQDYIKEETEDYIIVEHKQIGWSKNNRNVKGKLITVYSSQTTAHILDAVKSGPVRNENMFTFAAFKTLSDIGIDYDTAIAFLAQPAITKLLKIQQSKESIYAAQNINTIKQAYINLYNELPGLKDNEKIDKFISYAELIDKLMANSELNKAFIDLFNINIKTAFNKENHSRIILDGIKLEERLTRPIISNNISDIAYDLGMTLFFDKLKNTGESIGALARCVTSDKFGAKQTIRSTRNIIENVAEYSKNKSNIGNTVVVRDKSGKHNLLTQIYPFEYKTVIDKNGEEISIPVLNIKKSKYPSLAAFFKYSTELSYKVNSELFDTERIFINERGDKIGMPLIVEKFENILGRKLTDSEYKEFKQYVISSIFKEIPILISPIKLTQSKNDFNIEIDNYIENPDVNEITPNITEIYRIFGYEETQSSDLKIKNKNNPTTEEIDKFRKLTPAQKVFWMQQNLEDESIFNKLKVNLFNDYEYKNYGYSSQTIKYDDLGGDIEELFKEFNNIWFTTNPLIKLTAIDLIKYAMIAEGYKFKKGNISKIIPNHIIYNSFEDNGLDITNSANELFIEKCNPKTSKKYIELFIRSHPEIIKTINLGGINKERNNASAIFTRLNQNNGIVAIEANDKNSKLLDKLFPNFSRPNYLNINRKLANNKFKNVLYKIEYVIDEDENILSVYLLPLNKLERSEHDTYNDFSVNKNNNQYAPVNYYESVIDNQKQNYPITVLVSKIKTSDNEEFKEFYTKTVLNNITFVTPNTKSNTNPYLLENAIKSENTIESRKAEKFKEDIIKNIDELESLPVEGRPKFFYIHNDSQNISTAFATNEVSIQEIEINGEKRTFSITKVKNKRIFASLQGSEQKNRRTKLTIAEQRLVNQLKNTAIKIPTLYKIEEVILKDVVDKINERFKESEKNSDDVLYAITNLIEEIDVTENNTRKESDGFMKDIYNMIVQDAMEGDELSLSFKQAIQNLNIDWNNDNSRRINNTSVYKILADYIQHKANKLIYKIEHFETDNGEEFSIDDVNLYKYIKNNPQSFIELNKLLLDSKTFGNTFKDIFNINFEYEDNITKYNIEKIKNSLLNVRNHNKLKQAFNLMFNYYLANELSNNQYVKQGLIDVTTSFKDTDWFDTQFSDIGFVDNKQVQLIVKLTNRILERATRINAPKAMEEYEKEYNEIMSMDGDYNESKIISYDGKLILPYNEKFIEDKNNFISNLNNIRIIYGENSLEYIREKLKYDRWKLNNLEQPLVREYYEKDIELREKIINEIPELYLQYKTLISKLYKDNRPINLLSESEKVKRQQLLTTIKSLSSEFTELGEFKTGKELEDAKKLNEYIQNNKKLQNTYYSYEGSEEFKTALNKYLKIIEQYEKDHKDETISQRLMDSNYREAYDWIKTNTVYQVDENTKTKINEAFKLLRKENEINKKIKQILKTSNAYDNYGTVDPRKLTAEQIAEIKALYEKQNEIYNNEESKTKLIKDVPETKKVELTDKAKNILSKLIRYNPEKEKIIKQINEIISKIITPEGRIRSKDIFEKLTIREQNKLVGLYDSLNSLESTMSAEEAKILASMFNNEINDKAFDEEYSYYEKHIKGDLDKEMTWKIIFASQTKDGQFPIDKKTKKLKPNKYVYGYSTFKKQFIDIEKTNAKNIITSSVEYIPSEYYFDAAMEAKRNGTYNEWYEKNHYFNPFTDSMQPLNIWTIMNIKESEYVKPEYSYSPTFENNYKTIRSDKFKNKKYKSYSSNYNQDSGEYNNMNHLSEKEKKMVELFRNILNKYALSKHSKKFVDKGYLPRQYKANIDLAWFTTQALGALGLEFRKTGENNYREELKYNDDIDNYTSDPMLEFLKLTGIQKLQELPEKGIFDNDEEYKKKIEEIVKKNKEIEAQNLKLESEVLDRNWKEVFKQFIKVGEENIARNQIKNPIYLLLEDLKERNAIQTSRRSKKVIFNRSRSTTDTNIPSEISHTNTVEIVENWARRVIYKEFKKDSIFKPFADFAQNFTSAKYMIANLPGGIKNIGTGFVNIAGEFFAGEYFDRKELRAGVARYLKNSMHILADMYQDTSNNETAAILKFFEVIKFDEILEKRTNESIEGYSKRVRDLLYGFQSGGEHYMQNSVLLAMLKSHRMITNSDGSVELGSYSDYIWNIETDVIKELINDNPNLKTAYQRFLKEIKDDLNKQKYYDNFRADFNRNFIESLNDKDITKKYIELKKERSKTAKAEFEKLPVLEDLIRVENGKVTIKEGDKLTFDMLMDFGNKVKYVNKQIHGVYDKIGAAKIESEWWGGLVMQYHKHLYPGIMKRWRVNGYYNEQTQSTQVGSYNSLNRFLSLEFNKAFAENNEEGHNIIKSIKNIILSSINTIFNMKVNWDMMSEWEKRNILRVRGDLYGIVGSLLIATAIYAFTDDEDEEESNIVATALYIADALLGETQLYTPWGLYTEGKTQWSNPIAATSTITDLLKGLDLLTNMLFDDDFDPNYKTGRYAGENKLKVLLYKNTPIWRIWKRLSSMTKSNSYFRLNDNAWNMKTAKNVADWITGENEEDINPELNEYLKYNY